MSKTTLKDLPPLADELGMKGALVESFLFACKLKNLTAKSMQGYGERIAYLMRWAATQGKDLDQLVKHDLQKYVTSLIDRVSVATINGRIAVYKVFFRHLKDEGFIEVNPMAEIRKMKQPKLIKEVLTPADMGKVLAQLDRKTFNGSRDFCMLLLAFDAMVRCNELLSIKVDELDLQTGLLKVFGKGRKERYVAFSPQTAKVLHTYLVRFRKQIPGDLLFCTRDGHPIGQRRVRRIFSNPARKVGLHLYPHMARHSGATQFARSGGSLAILQRALGHSTLAVTERYVHMGDEDILKAYEKHSPAAGIRV
jgi:site-specific recombinase XerD